MSHVKKRRKSVRRMVSKLLQRVIYRNSAAGLLVSLKGNIVAVDGLKFDVSNPAISLALKGRFLFGVYERAEIVFVKEHLLRDLPAIEIGGCLGVVSCLTNRLLNNPEQHLVVEANGRLVPIIERNRELNGSKFKVLQAALAYDVDEIEFWVHKLVTASTLNQGRATTSVKVPTKTLKDLLKITGFDRINLIVDIEGAEVELLKRELDVIAEHVEVLIMETHPDIIGEDTTDQIVQTLTGAGLTCVENKDGQIVMKKTV